MIRRFIFCMLFVLSSAPLYAKVEVAPYYNYQFVEGVSVAPTGEFGFLVDLSNDIGILVKPVEKHSFIGFYSIKYQGPGLKKQEGREFSERYLDHLFVGRHHWQLRDDIMLKTQFDVILEGRRSGTNENWDNGLYNFNRYGGSSSFTKKIGAFDITPTFKYHYMVFPNYTDMLAELRSGADASASEGKQNNHIVELGGRADYINNTFRLNVTQQLYTKQKVAVDKVQSDGSYYSSQKQKDFTLALSLSRVQPFLNSSVIVPQLDFTYKDSNQNYQHFTDVTSTTPVKFIADYNDYTEIALSVPLTFAFTRKWALIFNPTVSLKNYTKRGARDANGDFMDNKKQSRVLSIATVGLRNQIGESSSSMIFFTYQKQTSNMEFEKYLPYNYTGFSAGFKFQMEY